MKKNKDKSEVIRSTSTSLKFSNTNKLISLSKFIEEYKKVVAITVDYLWNLEKIPSLLPKEITDKFSNQTWLSARAIQSACKQASGIVRGTRTKQKKRLKQIEVFKHQGMYKKARKLQKKYDSVKISKPNIKNVCPELDERFVETNLSNPSNETFFDGWITLTSLGNKIKLTLPFKKTKHFNEMLKLGNMKNGVRISPNKLTFNFSIKKPVLKTEGKVLGIDIGIKDVCALSDNSKFEKDIHEHTLETIQQKLSRKTKGSKAFKKAQKHRANHIKWILNQINLDGVKTLRIEDIKYLRRGKRSSRFMSAWTYPVIKSGLEDIALWSGVQVVKISPAYTSQRCSRCGWTRKKNRKGKKFVCAACGFACDADHNASINISLDLPEISKEERLLHKNKISFYWHVVGQEPIVSAVQKAG